MKTAMKFLTAMMIVVVLMSCIPTVYAEDLPEFYPRLTVVVEVTADAVICEDKEGNLWAFFADPEDGWGIGDLCILLMWNQSEDIRQHEIVEVYWEGYVESPDLLGW